MGKSSQNPKFLGFQLGVVGVFNLSGKHLNLSIMGWPSLLFPRQNGSDCYYKEHPHSPICDFLRPFLRPLPSGPSLKKRLLHTSSKTLEGRCPSPYNLLSGEIFQTRGPIGLVYLYISKTYEITPAGEGNQSIYLGLINSDLLPGKLVFACFLSLKGRACLVGNAQHETGVDGKVPVALCVEMQKADIW